MLVSSRQWYPLNTTYQSRPKPGQLIAYEHAVWRVTRVEDTDLSDADRDVWLDQGMPDLATWRDRPYRVTVEWVGGARPSWVEGGDLSNEGGIDIPAGTYLSWDVYPGDRWPQCSCCGEPMPCRAELEDDQVAASLDRIARLEAVPAGACWACAEQITARQKAVTYPGENLDLPGGQQVLFHTRSQCVHSARRYEEEWVAADPRRERILTWPKCGGILVVHGDGSSECVTGRAPLGSGLCESQPDCRGHLTHDHGTIRACYVHDDWLSPNEWRDGSCPRGCSRDGHPGTAATPRPERRQPSMGELFQ